MSADVDRLGTQCGKLAKEFLSVSGISVVRFVIAKIIPDGRQGSIGSISEHLNLHGWGHLLCPAGCTSVKEQRDKQEYGVKPTKTNE
jgi:hypothetical protein